MARGGAPTQRACFSPSSCLDPHCAVSSSTGGHRDHLASAAIGGGVSEQPRPDRASRRRPQTCPTRRRASAPRDRYASNRPPSRHEHLSDRWIPFGSSFLSGRRDHIAWTANPISAPRLADPRRSHTEANDRRDTATRLSDASGRNRRDAGPGAAALRARMSWPSASRDAAPSCICAAHARAANTRNTHRKLSSGPPSRTTARDPSRPDHHAHRAAENYWKVITPEIAPPDALARSSLVPATDGVRRRRPFSASAAASCSSPLITASANSC
jgi:hypothetical protein